MLAMQEDGELLFHNFALTSGRFLEKVMLNIVRHLAPHYSYSPSESAIELLLDLTRQLVHRDLSQAAEDRKAIAARPS
jgi:hypothetical protein